MIYIDTGIIVSYMDEADANHSRAVKLIQSLRGEKLVTSRLALVELASVYSRAGLEDPLALALYSIEETGVELAEIDFNDALSLAFRLSAELRLRTLDLLHNGKQTTGSKVLRYIRQRHNKQEGPGSKDRHKSDKQ